MRKLNLGTKECLQCKSTIVLKIKRDIDRKNFCNRSCMGSYYGKRRIEHVKSMIKLSQTPEANSKKSHKGEKHPRFIKDRTKLKSKRPRKEQIEFRNKVFERDNYTCQICFKYGEKLQADHIKPYCAYPELKDDINNGRTLCVDCHKKTDTYGAKAYWKMKRGEYDKIISSK